MNILAEVGPQVDGVVITSAGAQRPVRMLVDTGADVSMLAEDVLTELRSTPEGVHEVGGVFSTPESREVHVITLRLVLTDGITREFPDAFLTSMPKADDGVDGLLGRDMLAYLNLAYDGLAGTFTLTS